MELHLINHEKAAKQLLDCRQQMADLKDRYAKLCDEFVSTIFLDAIEQPSRVLPLGNYWRSTGLLPLNVCNMIEDFLKHNDNPDFVGIRAVRVPIKCRYAEFDENGNPTGDTVEREEDRSLLINLGAVKPPRKCTHPCQYNMYGRCAHGTDGRCSPHCKEWQTVEPVFGADPLVDNARTSKAIKMTGKILEKYRATR